ncbi:MAG: transglycosylase SLT domain-containing protein [Thermodesulfobacteriota bacterium]|nr:transglycosylase SLT domain-containing protein [Thermodesulfobacteriota bacterium]
MIPILAGCAPTPPKNMNNACAIFEDKSGWYKSAKKSYKKWGIPIHVQLAIMRQESKFTHDARPPRRKLLWIIPWFRPTTAYGYAQVKDSTWDWYVKKSGNRGADRDDFGDAVDFIGWYGNVSARSLGISRTDAYNQYLAYHEGHGGFKKRTYLKKKWLIKVARKVAKNAGCYRAQLASCEESLDSGWWFWPF